MMWVQQDAARSFLNDAPDPSDDYHTECDLQRRSAHGLGGPCLRCWLLVDRDDGRCNQSRLQQSAGTDREDSRYVTPCYHPYAAVGIGFSNGAIRGSGPAPDKFRPAGGAILFRLRSPLGHALAAAASQCYNARATGDIITIQTINKPQFFCLSSRHDAYRYLVPLRFQLRDRIACWQVLPA